LRETKRRSRFLRQADGVTCSSRCRNFTLYAVTVSVRVTVFTQGMWIQGLQHRGDVIHICPLRLCHTLFTTARMLLKWARQIAENLDGSGDYRPLSPYRITRWKLRLHCDSALEIGVRPTRAKPAKSYSSCLDLRRIIGTQSQSPTVEFDMSFAAMVLLVV